MIGQSSRTERHVARKQRMAEIKRLLADGATASAVGRQYDLSRERIRQIARDGGFAHLISHAKAGALLRHPRRSFKCEGCGKKCEVIVSSRKDRFCGVSCRYLLRERQVKKIVAMRRRGVGWAEIGETMGYGSSGYRRVVADAFRWAPRFGIEIPLGVNYRVRPGRRPATEATV